MSYSARPLECETSTVAMKQRKWSKMAMEMEKQMILKMEIIQGNLKGWAFEQNNVDYARLP